MRRLAAALLLLAGIIAPLLPALPAGASESPGARALDWAEAHATGCWYVYGGTGPCSRGYDCSGLVMTAAHATGTPGMPRTTYSILAWLAAGHGYRVPVASAPRGALMFYGPGHIEINTLWRHTTFGAHATGQRIGWITWGTWWHPTSAWVLRLPAGYGEDMPRRSISRLVRHRMAETGEKYTVALRAIQADPAEHARLRAAERQMRERTRYPSTPRDGLDARHVLSSWETQRRKH